MRTKYIEKQCEKISIKVLKRGNNAFSYMSNVPFNGVVWYIADGKIHIEIFFFRKKNEQYKYAYSEDVKKSIKQWNNIIVTQKLDCLELDNGLITYYYSKDEKTFKRNIDIQCVKELKLNYKNVYEDLSFLISKNFLPDILENKEE